MRAAVVGLLLVLGAPALIAAAEAERVAALAVGPRGPAGPDVPLDNSEKGRVAKRVTAEGRTAAAVQAACDRATREGMAAVFLPAGEYVFEAEVRAPAGLTVLGEGTRTVIRTKDKATHLFSAVGGLVRFTRLKLQGADAGPGTDNDSYGISVAGKQNVRIDHCELAGFSYATNFADEAAAQVDHCHIHHNLRDGLGYGVAIYSGAYVLVSDNEFSQNRHSLASNGALDWSSPKRAGKYLHKTGVRKTHWEFIHNRVGSNDLSPNELCAVDTHPGMDGTFVVEGNLFENLRHGVGIRDGSGLVRGNLFRDLRTRTNFRSRVAVSVHYDTHNNVPVEGCMPHDIQVAGNTFVNVKDDERYQVGKAENVMIEGRTVPETRKDVGAPPPMPLLVLMDDEGKLGITRRAEGPKPSSGPRGE